MLKHLTLLNVEKFVTYREEHKCVLQLSCKLLFNFVVIVCRDSESEDESDDIFVDDFCDITDFKDDGCQSDEGENAEKMNRFITHPFYNVHYKYHRKFVQLKLHEVCIILFCKSSQRLRT